ncbi:MAG TPA: hypothetical protein DCO72_02935 [Ruminococcus sp.]|nr:hypothetical protein [Ruminococcus sp.]
MLEKRDLQEGKWKRTIYFDGNTPFNIITENHTIKITGGSIIIIDKHNGNILNRLKGYHCLYTGDVNPDETELFALENGKHFYIISLKTYSQTKRITLPRSYLSLDVYGTYSEDGKSLFVPVYKYFDNAYHYWMCEYETNDYTLVDMKEIPPDEVPRWISFI